MDLRHIALTVLLLTAGCLVANAEGSYKDYYKKPATKSDVVIAPSTTDYSDIARKLTADCTDDYQKIRNIYEWICRNIDYDTSYTIYEADECFKKKKGVCQAYCELFFLIAQAADVKAEIVSGITRDHLGKVSNQGHVWIFAYTRPDYGILLDPTWGAGTVDGHTFTRSKDCWKWFGVNAEWLILSHLPNDKSYQLLNRPLDKKEFTELPAISTLWADYGFDPHLIFEHARSHTLSLPKLYSRGEEEFEIVDIPLHESLKIGQFYTFRVKTNTKRELAIINGSIFCKADEWKKEPGEDGVYTVTYMPRETDRLSISLADPQKKGVWNTIVKYGIELPTNQDWERVEPHYPLCIPEARNVKRLDPDGWARMGIDNRQLLKIIREQKIDELPMIYANKGQELTISSFPMNRQLTAGQRYTFSFYPHSGHCWAIINNGKWFKEWTVAEDGCHSMTVTPTTGQLDLYVQIQPNELFTSTIGYEVK